MNGSTGKQPHTAFRCEGNSLSTSLLTWCYGTKQDFREKSVWCKTYSPSHSPSGSLILFNSHSSFIQYGPPLSPMKLSGPFFKGEVFGPRHDVVVWQPLSLVLGTRSNQKKKKSSVYYELQIATFWLEEANINCTYLWTNAVCIHSINQYIVTLFAYFQSVHSHAVCIHPVSTWATLSTNEFSPLFDRRPIGPCWKDLANSHR